VKNKAAFKPYMLADVALFGRRSVVSSLHCPCALACKLFLFFSVGIVLLEKIKCACIGVGYFTTNIMSVNAVNV